MCSLGVNMVVVLVALLPAVHGARMQSQEADAALQSVEEAFEVQEAIAYFEEALAREQSRTDADSQREALSIFHELVAPWEYKGVSGSEPLTCENHTYMGPVSGIGSGAHGITVMMHRGSSSGPKVVAKFWKGQAGKKENLNHECLILQRLEKSGVSNVLRCEAACEHNGNIMIVVSPFIDGNPKSFYGPLKPRHFESPVASHKAVKETLRIGFSMLESEVVNTDQGHNILYLKDGTTIFIDMGLAQYLPETQPPSMRMWFVNRFLDTLLAKVPASWWQDGQAARILSELKWPSTPAYLKTDPPDFAQRIREKILAKGANLEEVPLATKPA